MAEGQLQASGNLITATGNQLPGRIPVIINITDENLLPIGDQVPGGALARPRFTARIFTMSL